MYWKNHFFHPRHNASRFWSLHAHYPCKYSIYFFFKAKKRKCHCYNRMVSPVFAYFFSLILLFLSLSPVRPLSPYFSITWMQRQEVKLRTEKNKSDKLMVTSWLHNTSHSGCTYCRTSFPLFIYVCVYVCVFESEYEQVKSNVYECTSTFQWIANFVWFILPAIAIRCTIIINTDISLSSWWLRKR